MSTMYRQFTMTPHIQAVFLDCNFVIDSGNGNGLGQRNLKGQGIFQVYSHSTVPIAGNNVPVGFLKVFFNDPFFRYYGGFSGFVSQVSGTPILVTAGLVVGTVYVIVAVGTTTQAEWQALGVPAGTLAAVGVAFIATSAVAGVGTGVVEIPAVNGSGISRLDVIGDPTTTLLNQPPGTNVNPYMILRMFGTQNPGVATAPADGSVCGLAFYLSNSSVLIAGE
jgi:hypothetical protein